MADIDYLTISIHMVGETRIVSNDNLIDSPSDQDERARLKLKQNTVLSQLAAIP
jgi:hypothetical protein